MKFLIVSGIIFFLAPLLFFIPNELELLKVLKEGKIITATIVSKPHNCSAKNKICSFRYGEEKFIKRVGRDFCKEHHNGDAVQFMYSANYPRAFAFPNSESYEHRQIGACILLSLFGLVVLVIGVRNYKGGHRFRPAHTAYSRQNRPNRRSRRHPKGENGS